MNNINDSYWYLYSTHFYEHSDILFNIPSYNLHSLYILFIIFGLHFVCHPNLRTLLTISLKATIDICLLHNYTNILVHHTICLHKSFPRDFTWLVTSDFPGYIGTRGYPKLLRTRVVIQRPGYPMVLLIYIQYISHSKYWFYIISKDISAARRQSSNTQYRYSHSNFASIEFWLARRPPTYRDLW